MNYSFMIYYLQVFLFITIILVLSVKYIVHNSRAKIIEIKNNFIRDHVENGDFLLEFVDFRNHLAHIFTKSLLEEIFCFLQKRSGITKFSP